MVWGVVLTPLVLVLLIIVLLYIPPVQDYLRKEATVRASAATGMEITVDRIDLRFPLRHIAAVSNDTLQLCRDTGLF